ncbi:Charged multivesicular body protein 7 [Trichinella pseudospiralis]|uniref:Charged multivesicular body protein 7 n=1 Tax=Trichinella pseudospiralis TaxID=6337 RepID=A0A0V0YIV3_TRIPS|nr:Charged multivesicular body protein 7 [Trichinella pseudospiralis]
MQNSLTVDDETMQHMFSKFRSKESNPNGYSRKLQFWMDSIRNLVYSKGNPIFTLGQLKQEFQWKNYTPACLDHVIYEMLKGGIIMTRTEYENSLYGWFYKNLQKILRESWNYIFPHNNDREIEYVYVALVKSLGEQILCKVQKLSLDSTISENVISWNELRREIADICPLKRALDLVLSYLQSVRLVSSYQTDDAETLLKFCLSSENVYPEITDIDISIYKLEDFAVVSTRQKKYSEAKRFILKKRYHENILANKLDAIYNLQSLYLKLMSAKNNAMVTGALETSKTALRNKLNADISFSEVQTTLDEIQEAMVSIIFLVQHYIFSNFQAAEVQTDIEDSLIREKVDFTEEEIENEFLTILERVKISEKEKAGIFRIYTVGKTFSILFLTVN